MTLPWLLSEELPVEFSQRWVFRLPEASRQAAEGSRGSHQTEVPPRAKVVLHCLARVTQPIHLDSHNVPIESNVVPNYHPPVLRHGTDETLDHPAERYSIGLRHRGRNSVDPSSRGRNGEIRRVDEMCFGCDAVPRFVVRRPGDLHETGPLASCEQRSAARAWHAGGLGVEEEVQTGPPTSGGYLPPVTDQVTPARRFFGPRL